MRRDCARRTVTSVGIVVLLGGLSAIMPAQVPAAQLAQPNMHVQPPQPDAAQPTDPRQILQDALRRSDTLDAYQVTFHVREKRGVLRALSPWEQIRIDYHKSPKAIRMAWLNSSSEYAWAIYVEGRNNDRMHVLPRRGILGFAPRTFSVEPAKAVSYGKAIRPITDIGLSELIRITLHEVQQAGRMGPVRITYAGRSKPSDLNEPADHVVIFYPQGYADATRQDIYISTRTGYPIASYLWQPDGNLLAAYLYGTPNPVAPSLNGFDVSGNAGIAG